MTLRGRATQLLLNRVGRARMLQSLALPPAPGDLVFIGDGLSLHGGWPEWFPGETVRVLGDEALLIDDARRLVAAVAQPRALVLLLGTADLMGLAGSPAPQRSVQRLDALVAAAAARVGPASVFVVGVPARPALGRRAASFNFRAESLVLARGATFVPAPVGSDDADDGYLVSLIRWDAPVYAAIAAELARATGLVAAAARPAHPLVDEVKGFL